MNFRNFKNRILHMTFKEIACKAAGKLLSITFDKVKKYRCLYGDPHIKGKCPAIAYNYIDIEKLDVSAINCETAEYLCDRYVEHRFDLLGSGWVKVGYSMSALGVEGNKYNMSPPIKDFVSSGEWLYAILRRSHLKFSKNILRHIRGNYENIDWQMDFKSGYRFDQKKWYKNQRVNKPGVDIKVPWELSRMQHLPQMAVFSVLLYERRQELIQEFKNEILDFILSNPPGMGVNWACTMDVGIRVSNMLLAFDIFKQLDDRSILDDSFEKILSQSVYEHGIFIINNLEWCGRVSSNHYLGDMSGLLFASAYLESSSLTGAWLAFSIQEIIGAVRNQFHYDGTSFEGSTSYHRLSSEFMVYDTALIYGILNTDKARFLGEYDYKLIKRLLPCDSQKYDITSSDFFPDWYIERLFKAACFTVDIAKPSGDVPQIGDNDSGRFFRLSPCGRFLSIKEVCETYKNLEFYGEESLSFNLFWDENALNHGVFVSAAGGLFDNNYLRQYQEGFPLERSIIKSMSKGKKHKMNYSSSKPEIKDKITCTLGYNKTFEIQPKGEKDMLDGLESICYPWFGLYIYKSRVLYLIVSGGGCGSGDGSHIHNDSLSFELNIDGDDIFIDPGTYLYTPCAEKRNMFRCTRAHNTVIAGCEEQNELLSLFEVKQDAKGGVLEYGRDYIKLYLKYRNVCHMREIKIYRDRIILKDWCSKDFTTNFNMGNIYSNGYGKLINRTCKQNDEKIAISMVEGCGLI